MDVVYFVYIYVNSCYYYLIIDETRIDATTDDKSNVGETYPNQSVLVKFKTIKSLSERTQYRMIKKDFFRHFSKELLELKLAYDSLESKFYLLMSRIRCEKEKKNSFYFEIHYL